MKDRLNLGCGKDILEGWINVDAVKGEGVDRVFDLNKYPWPLKDNQFRRIKFKSILEHLDNPEKAIREIWRISKRNCIIFVEVPHFSCWQSWGDISHKRPFTSTSLFSFSNKASHRRSASLLNSQKEKFDIKTKICFGKIKKILGFEFFFNLNNYSRGFYERNLCYIFPATNIEFYLTAIK